MSLICVYDIEVYPNLFMFSYSFIERVGDELKKSDEYHSLHVSDLDCDFQDLQLMKDEIKSIFDKSTLIVGYNSARYDDVVVDRFLKTVPNKNRGLTFFLNSIYEYSDTLISNMEFGWVPDKRRLDIMAFIVPNPPRLKKAAMLMRIPYAMTPVEFGTVITETNQIQEIEKYNIMDVNDTTHCLFNVWPDFIIREELDKEFEVKNAFKIKTAYFVSRIYQGTIAKGNRDVLPETYARQIPIGEFLPDTLFDYKFIDQRVNEIYSPHNSIEQYEAMCKKYNRHISIAGMDHCICSIGGAHGYKKHKDRYIARTDEDQLCMQVDMNSAYPSAIARYGLSPATYDHDDFVKRVDTDLDIRLKSTGLTKASKKLMLNIISGLAKHEYDPMCDTIFRSQIIFICQIGLWILAEMLHKTGIVNVLTVNTDGVDFVVKRGYEMLVEGVVKSWEDRYKIGVGRTHYNMMVLKDVNNRIYVTDKKVKTKGEYNFSPMVNGVQKLTQSRDYEAASFLACQQLVGQHETFKKEQKLLTDITSWSRLVGPGFIIGNRVYPDDFGLVVPTNNGERVIDRVNSVKRIDISSETGYKLLDNYGGCSLMELNTAFFASEVARLTYAFQEVTV